MSRPRWSRTARWAGLLGLGFAGLAGVAGWQAWHEMHRASRVTVPTAAAASGAAATTQRTPVLDSGALGPTQLPAPAPAAQVDDQRPLKPGEFELCGLGRRMGTPKPEEPEAAPDVQVEMREGAVVSVQRGLAWQRPAEVSDAAVMQQFLALLDRMAASGDVRQQGAALLLGRPGSTGATAPAQLVRLALASSDPVVMMWAQRVCRAPQPDAACSGLNARHWLRTDPGNVVAWLTLLQQEPAALEEALHGMALATHADHGYMRLWAPFEQAISADVPGYQYVAILDVVTGIEAAQTFAAFQPLMQACSVAAMASTNRQQACRAIGLTMADKGTDALLRAMGGALLKRLGNDPRRSDALRATQALSGQRMMTQLLSDQPYSCDMVAKRRAHARQISSQGEWATMEAMAKAQAALGH